VNLLLKTGTYLYLSSGHCAKLNMEKDKIDELKTQVESRLLQKITDLEAVKLELEEETKASTGAEKEKNENLLAATSNLLSELKQAQINIHDLIQKNS
jgi:hypothetical protein